jgi:hypothetical protein
VRYDQRCAQDCASVVMRQGCELRFWGGYSQGMRGREVHCLVQPTRGDGFGGNGDWGWAERPAGEQTNGSGWNGRIGSRQISCQRVQWNGARKARSDVLVRIVSPLLQKGRT